MHQQSEEHVFRESFIPRNLDEVVDIERDMERGERGDTEGVWHTHTHTHTLSLSLSLTNAMRYQMYYQKLMGIKQDLSGPQLHPTLLANTEANDADGDNDSGSESEPEDTAAIDGAVVDGQVIDDEADNTLSNKERKKMIKEMNREKRKGKTPKHVKKRKQKLAQRNR
jgi:RIO kinase 1